MKKFEYKTLVIKTKKTSADVVDAELNSMGSLGWELVSAVTTVGSGTWSFAESKSLICVFKREQV